ncbi:MAG: hypothetical protein KKE57_06600 [Proteobacteria bacterium]|nr:hypothetical protein [Pseudomonadota bacterium]
MKFRESLISANHNYLVNDMLSPGFVLGDPGPRDDFWFVADVVPPEERRGRIYGRLYDRRGDFILELKGNRTTENPGQTVLQSIQGGFRIHYPSGELLIKVHTRNFANGHLTFIHGKVYDKEGRLRMEPSYEGVKVHGKGQLALVGPYEFGESGH